MQNLGEETSTKFYIGPLSGKFESTLYYMRDRGMAGLWGWNVGDGGRRIIQASQRTGLAGRHQMGSKELIVFSTIRPKCLRDFNADSLVCLMYTFNAYPLSLPVEAELLCIPLHHSEGSFSMTAGALIVRSLRK